jgi:hypothetical protein
MKSRKNTVSTLIMAIVILASCTSTTINSSNEALISSKGAQNINISQYFSYQNFDSISIQKLEQYMLTANLKKNDLRELKKLYSNLKKISSKDSFSINIPNSSIFSFELMELAYKLELPITIKWVDSNSQDIPLDLLANIPSGFCSSIYEDAIDAITKEINDSTVIIYMKPYFHFQKLLVKQFPEVKSILFNKGNAQNFASNILGIDESQKRFKKISSLNPNQTLEFEARPRDDIDNILLLLQPSEYRSVLPAFRYHGGEKFKYINFISVLENLNHTNQLMDFENSLVPISPYLTEKIKDKESFSLDQLMQRSMINDWLLVEIVKQAGVQSAKISGMTGDLDFQKNSCAKRNIPMQLITSKWITS